MPPGRGSDVSPGTDVAAALRLIAEARARLDAAEALLRGTEPPRPPAPTREWCLPAPGVVRWDGEVTIPLRRWHLLDALLSRRLPAAVADLDDVTREANDAAFRMALSRLNHDLESVRWPVAYRLRGSFVVAD